MRREVIHEDAQSVRNRYRFERTTGKVSFSCSYIQENCFHFTLVSSNNKESVTLKNETRVGKGQEIRQK